MEFTGSELRKHFDEVGDSGLRGESTEHALYRYAHYILNRTAPKLGARCLEIGCGDGKITELISKIRPDLTIYGTDFSSELIKDAKPRENSNLTFRQWDATSELTDSSKYDVILSFSVAQYISFKKFIELNASLLFHLNNGGRIVHMSIPDKRKRALIEANSRIEAGAGTISAIGRSVLNALRTRPEVFSRQDGSVFHDASKIESELSRTMNCEIVVPSDSWYRFDVIVSAKK